MSELEQLKTILLDAGAKSHKSKALYDWYCENKDVKDSKELKYLIEDNNITYKATKDDKYAELFCSDNIDWTKPDSFLSSLEDTGNGFLFVASDSLIELSYSDLFELMTLAKLLGEKADGKVYELKEV